MIEKIKYETNSRMSVLLARYIKKQRRECKHGDVTIDFSIAGGDSSYAVSFGENTYNVKCDNEGLVEIFQEALNMSGNGIVFRSKGFIHVTMYGSPEQSFNTLRRTINKLSSIDIEDRQIMSKEGRYMCFDDSLCKEALSFIHNRSPRDKVQVSVVNVEDVETYLLIGKYTACGKKKEERQFHC